MGVNRPALPILGILLAVSGLVLGAFTFTSVSRIDAQITDYFNQNSWYKSDINVFNTNPSGTYLTFEDLTVEFELEQGESVYFSFTCKAHVEPILTFWSRVYIFFRVDGIFSSNPSAEVGMFNGANTESYMIHLQLVRDDLSAGVHNVTVDVWGDSTANYIWISSLFVQKVST
ncbi:MAG: hypothetical protein ACFE96_06615 [Candidatus Hermodarchaeota archaeon]